MFTNMWGHLASMTHMSAARGAEFKIRSEQAAFATMNIVADARFQNAQGQGCSVLKKGTEVMTSQTISATSDDPNIEPSAVVSEPPDHIHPAAALPNDTKQNLSPAVNVDTLVATKLAKSGRGRPFAPGTSGNPKGRPKGSLGWKARSAKELLAEDVSEIMKTAVALAKSGDQAMIKLCLSLAMNGHETVVTVEGNKLDSPSDCRDAIGAVIESALAGELTFGDAKAAIELIGIRKASFGMAEPQKEFEADYVYELFLDMVASHPVGNGSGLDVLRICTMSKDLAALELPETVYNQVFRMYYDFAHKLSDVGGTPEEFVREIQEFANAWEKRQEDINRLGLEGYRASIGWPGKHGRNKKEG